jgi:EAL domain-containing protein (putative c-di-GMP-specific phosphodiesterase class I)
MMGGEAAQAALQKLKRLGVHLLVDDFGVGSSSLSFLRRLPVDALKIDRSLVRDLITREGGGITTAVIALAHALELQVVAKGVETEEQRAFLAARGCDRVQGHLLGEPVPAESCTTFLSRRA